jgi:hypothetical protein
MEVSGDAIRTKRGALQAMMVENHSWEAILEGTGEYIRP